MNRRWTLLFAVAVAMWVSADCPLLAQTGGSQQTGGTGSGTGSSLGGGSGTAGSAATLSRSRGFGLNNRFTGSGFDQYTTGSSTMGQTTAGARAATAGAFGQQSGSQSGSRFGSNGIGGMGGMGNIMGGMMGGMMGGNRNMMGGMGTQQTNSQQKSVRTHLRLGFAKPTLAAGAVSTRFTGVVHRVLEREEIGGGQVTVSIEGDTAVLTGTVASDHARSVVESLAMLEPGIGAVRNELTVDPDVPKPATEPTSRSLDRRR